MKPSEQRLSEACRQHIEAIVAQHVHQLFQRLPMLWGFWPRPDLKVAELSVFTWPGRDLYEEVTQSLVEFAEEWPEAAQLMRGRTFARTVH